MKAALKRFAKRAAITGGLHTSRAMQMAGLMRQARGRGAIFTLHHVRPKTARAFDPNGGLEITPDFLDRVLSMLKAEGYRFISLDALPGHLETNDQRPVAVFTLDDGYRNNLEFAAPVFSKHNVPFTVFVTGGFIDRTHALWWEVLEKLLETNDSLRFRFGSTVEALGARTTQEKNAAFGRIVDFIGTGNEAGAVDRLLEAAEHHGFDAMGLTRTLTLDAAGLRTLLDNPLASLGAHTISHRALARLDDSDARAEMEQSALRVEAITGKRPRSLAYPYGFPAAVSAREHRIARDLGFETAVTTQPGTLSASLERTALPRISINGQFQKLAHVSALASGIPFKLMGR